MALYMMLNQMVKKAEQSQLISYESRAKTIRH